MEILELINIVNKNDYYKNPINTCTIFNYTSNKLAKKRILFYLMKNLILLPNQQDLVLKLTDQYLEMYNAKYDKIEYQITKIYDDNFESFKEKQIDTIKNIYEKFALIYKKNQNKSFIFLMYLIKINFLMIKNEKTKKEYFKSIKNYTKNNLIMNNKRFNFFKIKIEIIMDYLFKINTNIPYYIIQNFENDCDYLNEIYLFYLYKNEKYKYIIELFNTLNIEKNYNSLKFYNYCLYYIISSIKINRIFDKVFLDLILKFYKNCEKVIILLINYYNLVDNSENFTFYWQNLIKKSIKNFTENFKIWEFYLDNIKDINNLDSYFNFLKKRFINYIKLKEKNKCLEISKILIKIKPEKQILINNILNKLQFN